LPASPRPSGLRGRQPKKNVADRFPLAFIHQYTGPLPAPAYPIDVSSGITAWGMLGNGPDPTCTTHPNGVGDCGFAGRQHYRMAKAAYYGETETWETSNELVAEYLAYDHGQDAGVNIADVLLAWYKAGKILAFAPVDHTDPVQVDAAMQAFIGVLAGVNLTDDADERFQQGEEWTVANGQQPDPNEGHCVVKVKATGSKDTWLTWGADQDSTTGWTRLCLDEAWVFISSEDEIEPSALAMLRADIDALHGTGGQPPAPQPVPVPPAPGPQPAPGPGPLDLLDELANLIRAIAADDQRGIDEALAWLDAHGF
jgi:hypothetical protein